MNEPVELLHEIIYHVERCIPVPMAPAVVHYSAVYLPDHLIKRIEALLEKEKVTG